VLNDERYGDAVDARLLLRRLAVQGVNGAVIAASAGAVSVAFPKPEPLDPALYGAVVGGARVLASRAEASHRAALGAAALILLVEASLSDDPIEDLLRAAEAARAVELHRLAAVAAQRVIARPEATAAERARAWLILALVDRSQQALRELTALLPALSDDDPTRVRYALLAPTLGAATTAEISRVGAALHAADRAAAAAAFCDTVKELLEQNTEDRLLRGLMTTMEALSAPEIDGDAARRGLSEVMAHARTRRRAGEIPAVARAGTEIVVDLLTLAAAEGGADLLCETVEALADAGLSTLEAGFRVSVGDPSAGAVVQSLMAERTTEVRWPNLAWVARRLGRTHVLLLHTQRRLTDAALSVLALHIRPPNGVAIKKVTLESEHLATLDGFTSESLNEIVQIAPAELDALVGMLLPVTLREAIANEAIDLVVVPDAALWTIPWIGSRTHFGHARSLTLAPSMSLWASLDPPDAPVASVLAFVDETVPGAERVVGALEAAHNAKTLRITRGQRRSDLALGHGHDLLLVFGHGAGSGLGYRLKLPDDVATALDIAAARPPKRAVIAGCWSAAAPPVSVPLSVPTALLLAGVRTLVGGLWPLPAVPTADLVARMIARLAAGETLYGALDAARDDLGLPALVDTGGVALFGRSDEPHAETALGGHVL
jgi:hypothetical protein